MLVVDDATAAFRLASSLPALPAIVRLRHTHSKTPRFHRVCRPPTPRLVCSVRVSPRLHHSNSQQPTANSQHNQQHSFAAPLGRSVKVSNEQWDERTNERTNERTTTQHNKRQQHFRTSPACVAVHRAVWYSTTALHYAPPGFQCTASTPTLRPRLWALHCAVGLTALYSRAMTH